MASINFENETETKMEQSYNYIGTRNKSEKALPVFMLLFVIGFVLGIFLVQFNETKFVKTGGLFSYEWINEFLYLNIDTNKFFYYCLRHRLSILLILFLICFCIASYVLFGTITFAGGICTGIWLSQATLQLGIKGPLIFLGMLFPQIVCYFPGYLLFINLVSRIRQHKRIMVIILCIVILFTIGIYLETYVNPIILHKMLKKFY